MNASVTRWCSRRFVLPLSLVFVLGVAVQAQAQDQPPSGNTRQPVIANQFNTVNGGALQQRRPGLTVQQGTAVHNGSTAFFDGNVVDERNFFGQMIRDIFVTILDSINQTLSLLSGSFGGDSPLSGLTDLIGQIGTTPTTPTTPTTTAPDITPTPTGTPPIAPPVP